MTSIRQRARRRFGDRGAAIVEMAIVAPFLALLVAGIVEFGTLWRDNLTVTTSTRASARVVSSLGDSYLADYQAILSLNSGLASIDGVTLEGVLIFDGAAVDGEPNPSCFDANGDAQDSASGNCNYYSAAEVATVVATDCSTACGIFPDNPSCAGALSGSYCPQSERSDSQAAGLSSVGVWVRVSRQFFTGIFPGDGVTITDRTVMKVEPK